VIIKEFKNCHTSDAMYGREDEEKSGNVGSEHESVSSDCETEDVNHKNTEAETDNRNGEQSGAGEAE
jgi:hypothetical protein